MTGAEITAAAKTAGKVLKVAKQVKKYIDQDLQRRIIVKRDLLLGRFHDLVEMPDGTMRAVPDFYCPDFEIRDREMTVFETGTREPFCDGMSLFPDKILSLDYIKAALGHDAGYAYLKEIAKAWGWTVAEVRWLFDAMFGDLTREEADRQKGVVMRAAGKALSRICYTAVRVFGGIYHKLKGGKRQ